MRKQTTDLPSVQLTALARGVHNERPVKAAISEIMSKMAFALYPQRASLYFIILLLYYCAVKAHDNILIQIPSIDYWN